MSERQIIALGGGGFLMENSGLLDHYVLAASSAPHPRICFLPTASGDADSAIVKFYRAFRTRDCTPSHCELFRRDGELRDALLGTDVIYVGGGNTANMLAIWRLHGVDSILEEAWHAGVVLAGISAGAICWFESGVSDSFGESLAPFDDCLGFLPGSHCPHFDGEANRRPRYHQLVASGELAAGLAADDCAALHFRGTELADVVSSRSGVAAYRVSRDGSVAREEAVSARLLAAAD